MKPTHREGSGREPRKGSRGHGLGSGAEEISGGRDRLSARCSKRRGTSSGCGVALVTQGWVAGGRAGGRWKRGAKGDRLGTGEHGRHAVWSTHSSWDSGDLMRVRAPACACTCAGVHLRVRACTCSPVDERDRGAGRSREKDLQRHRLVYFIETFFSDWVTPRTPRSTVRR